MKIEINWPHCTTCNFPLQDQGTPNGLVCLLCEAKDQITDLKLEIRKLNNRIAELEWPKDAVVC